MAMYDVQYKAATREALLQPSGAASISGYVNIGELEHGDDADDNLDNVGDNHVIFHHVQDLLYRHGEQNMQSIKIIRHRVTAMDMSIPAGVINPTTTKQITVAFTPTNASNKDVIYSSSDPDIATVNASGLITAVDIGTVTITATSKDTGVTDTLTIDVVAA